MVLCGTTRAIAALVVLGSAVLATLRIRMERPPKVEPLTDHPTYHPGCAVGVDGLMPRFRRSRSRVTRTAQAVVPRHRERPDPLQVVIRLLADPLVRPPWTPSFRRPEPAGARVPGLLPAYSVPCR